MDRVYKDKLDSSIRLLKNADHLVTFSYPLIKDPRLLVSGLQLLFRSLEDMTDAVLLFEQTYKNLPPGQHTNFNLKLDLLKKLSTKYNLSKDFFNMLYELHELDKAHRNSRVEFSRRDRFVICLDDFSLKIITLNLLKQYLDKTKVFIYNLYLRLQKYESGSA